MNNNERELERAGYDRWKLSSRDDELLRQREVMIEDDLIDKPEKLGKCPYCDEDVLDNVLFVEEDDEVFYHFSCYNYMKKEAEEESEK